MSSSHSKDFTFLGGRIPPEVESMPKNLKDVDQETFRKILKGKVFSSSTTVYTAQKFKFLNSCDNNDLT